MAYISNQWLNRGQQTRKRSWHPIPVKVRVWRDRSAWAVGNNVRVSVNAIRMGGEFQQINLEQRDLEQVASVLLDSCDDDAKERLALAILADLSDKRLLKLIGAATSSR